MYKRIFSLFTILIVLFTFTAISSAENAEWKNDEYDFSKIKTIYIEAEPTYDEGVKLSDLDTLKVQKAIETNQKYVKNIKITSDKTLADATVQVNISAWGRNRYWNMPRTEIEYRSITRIDGNGKYYTTQIPVPVYRPGYYSYTQYFSATYTLTDKDGTELYKRVDFREDAKKAYAMFGRATKDFFKAINELDKK